MSMSERQRVLAILNGQKPDQVPWFADLDYWMVYMQTEGLWPERWQGNRLYEANRELGTGFYLQGYFPFKEVYDGVDVQVENYNDVRITRVRTPYGDIRQVEKWLSNSYCWAYVEHFVKSWRDLRPLRYLFQHTYYEPDYQLARERYDLIGENGIVLCYLPRSAFMVMVVMLAGIEAVTYSIADAPDEFEETYIALRQNLETASEIALNSPAEVLMIPENLSSEVVGKAMYRRYVEPHHRRWVKRIKDAGKFSCVHVDGTLKGLIREVSETGFTFLEALTPHPVGDLPIEEWHNWVAPNTIMWGGIPGVYFTDAVSDEEFDAFVIRVLKVMRSAPRYVLGVADQVPPRSRPERIARVRYLVDKYGHYDS
jgi:hypothetical protein